MTRNNISIRSWNIQDSVGDSTNKFEIDEFLSKITESNIICLQETKAQIKIEGFVSYNSNRKNSRSGGVCILANNCIRKGISRVNFSESEDIVAIKFDKHFFRLDFDLYLVNFYISPSTSQYVKRNPGYTENIFAALNSLSHNLLQKGELILCGDANARTGVLPDYITSYNSSSTHDIYDDIGFQPDLTETRNNCDTTTVSPHCQLFLDLVINNQLKILNGRTLGDSMGNFTCHKWNGSSTVDYFVISSWARDLVNSLRVHSLNSYSDHCPLELKITTHKPFLAKFKLLDFPSVPSGYRWDNEKSPELFKNALENPNIHAILEEIVNNDYHNNHEANAQIASEMSKCLHDAADLVLKSTKIPKKQPHKKWFDWLCHLSKRNLNRLACRLSNYPKNNTLRTIYFTERNKHSRLIKQKKLDYLDRLNKAIEDGHVLNWKKFKQLKQENESSPLLDKFDLASFYEFFTNLYQKNDGNLENPPGPSFFNTNTAQDLSNKEHILNKPIVIDEVLKSIKNLKKGKSSSTDKISNEMLQNLSNLGIKALTKTFNHCLSSGSYPWHTSVITPIYKSGNPFSPDNYRAIAVGSCMGKLFSSILLDRLLLFKELHCPDPKEQLGFSKGAQTNDHVLTLKTLVDKYTKKNRLRLYACFVDLKKAFDSVSRDLLLHKITSLGIKGEFFNCLSDMYNKSVAKIKIANLLSPDIKIERGTEQGHPLSPDLFKLFIHDLSSLLKSTGDYPNLNKMIVSHLLWADDLVLLSLSAKSLQDNMDILFNFCKKMGLEINIKKTNVLTFCPTKRKPLYENFTLGDQVIKHCSKYCYLGIIFDQNGNFSAANNELRAKALRALYGLKNNIIKDSLSHKSKMILFDTLVKPVLLYGCQVLSPHSKTMKYLCNINDQSQPVNIMKYLAQDHYEKFHLKFIKWNLSVHQKASNIGCWGECGRYPLFYEATKLALDYFEHVKHCFELSDNSLLSAAFIEQKNLDLPWYVNISKIINKHAHTLKPRSRCSTTISEALREEFVKNWSSAKNQSPKLEFYNEIKTKFEPEKYLTIITNSSYRKSLTRYRISCHNLFVERGRYENPPILREDRWCLPCYFDRGLKTVENEVHVLTNCPFYFGVKLKNNFVPSSSDELIDMLSNPNTEQNKLFLASKTIHQILTINEHYTCHYKMQESHNMTGACVVL